MINKLINDDCLKVLAQIPDNSVDLIFADPPYWMRTKGILLRVEGTEFKGVEDDWDKFNSDRDYIDFTRSWLRECFRVLKKDGSFWVIGGMQCIYTIGGIMQELGFWFVNDVIWHKTNPTPNFKGTRLTNSHETLIWATKSEKSRYTFNYKTAKELNIEVLNFEKGERRQLGSVWRIGVANGNERLKDEQGNKLHSTQKPEELLYKIINISSKIGDLVLDPFGGTMTTAKIAKQTGRNYISIEKDTKYYNYGLKRLEQTVVQIGDIEKSIYDIKPLKAPLKDLINSCFLIENEQFYLEDISHQQVWINKEGKLVCEDGNILDIHTAAAKLTHKNVARVNGFDYWFVKRDNHLVSLKTIRENYRTSKS